MSELKVHIELTRFVQPEKIEIDANERAVNEKSPYCFFVCTTFDSFLNDLPKESKEKSCNSSLSVCFQYYIDNNVLVVYNVYVVTSHQKKGARGFVKILISNTSDTPLYQQIKDQIKDAILKEELVEGDALPSIRAFANDLKVSVLTIRRVYEELEQEGFIVSQVGIGTFVSTSNLELLRDSKRRLVEQKMADMIQTAKSLKISKEELNSMMDILYEED
ncbi:hypothetical protein HMPREF9457_03065 [Dorea formicigenerans 4_6_53AFAA]|nr:hypothetical protein HMPREF9457_03065 [Dorea formicigenerans 4_6_53AFAA]